MAERRADAGLTLIETLVVVVMMGLVAVVLAGVFTVIVRTTPDAVERADDARSQLAITTYFPEDVASTPRKSLGSEAPEWELDPTAPSGCGGGTLAGSSNLIRLRWSQGSTSYEAGYRFVDDGGWRIKRVSCTNASGATVTNMTSEIGPPASNPVAVALKTDSSNQVIGADLTITTIAGDTIRVDATSNNLDQTLSAIATGSTTTTTTTTTTTMPNSPPDAPDYSITAAAAVPVSFSVAPTDNDPGDTLTISVVSTPPGWVINDVTGFAITFTPDAADGSITYDVSDGTASDTGNITVTIVPPASTTTTTTTTTSSTTTTTTTLPCAASFDTVTPNPALNQLKENGTNDNLSPLQVPVTVTITTNGWCGGDLVLSYVRSTIGAPADRQPRSDPFGVGGTVVTLQAIATERWQDGIRTLNLVDSASGNVLDDVGLEIQ